MSPARFHCATLLQQEEGGRRSRWYNVVKEMCAGDDEIASIVQSASTFTDDVALL